MVFTTGDKQLKEELRVKDFKATTANSVVGSVAFCSMFIVFVLIKEQVIFLALSSRP